ncbi:MAG: IS1634 family transposase [Burkholderiales bacterium]
MYIAVVPNRSSPPAILLRESFREGGQVKNRTLANLSTWSSERIEALRHVLRGRPLGPPAARAGAGLAIERSWPHGHVAAVLGSVRRLDLERLLARAPSTPRALVVAMLVHRLLAPGSKLATARGLAEATRTSTLSPALKLPKVDEDDLYAALDWLLARQGAIEQALARRHLLAGQLVLYDVTSTYFEGRRCPLAKRGHSRDGKRDTLQIVFGVLTNAAGCPVAVEVFDGNTGDPKTLTAVLTKVRQRFGLERLILVGDRGMLTAARIREELAGVAGLAWITALRAPAIQALVHSGTLQLSLFDQQDLAEITHPDYPGERLIVCKNPLLAADRARTRQELLAATERDLAGIATAIQRGKRPLRGAAAIGLRVGKVLGRYKVGKHFTIAITDRTLHSQRDAAGIAAEAALDGLYVIRTNVPADGWPAPETVRAYKRLAAVERTFRSLKTVDLHVRPIHHRTADRVRAHVFLCLLAYYVEWHMRQALKPLLFDDDDHAAGEALRASVVAPAQRSPRAKAKAATKRTQDGWPVHSFQTLLADLATLTQNQVRPLGADGATLDILTTPTPLQQRAFELLGVSARV